MKNFIHKKIFWAFLVSFIVFVYLFIAILGFVIYKTTSNSTVQKDISTYFEDSNSRVGSKETKKTITGRREPEISSDQIDGSYQVVNGELSPTPTNESEVKAWKYFKAIAGEDFLNDYMYKVDFYNDSTSDIDASVEQSDVDFTKWNLNVNLAYISEKASLIYTLVHEYSHIYSLNSTQVDGLVSGSCPNLKIIEGCVIDQSNLDQFYSQFWTRLNADPDSQDYGQYYQGNETDFVTEYAATNGIEDFAETFAYYALKDTSDLIGVAAHKISFMDRNDDIRNDVNRIRDNIDKLI